MRSLFLDRPLDHIGAQRSSFSRVDYGYAGTYYQRPKSWADRAARVVTVVLVLGTLGLLMGGA